MAKDDYHVIAYRILVYLYACLKQCEKPNLEYLACETDAFPIGESYWQYILSHLYEDGYIEGVILMPVLRQQFKSIKLTPDMRITPKGIEYLQENSAMQKAKSFLKDLREIIPGL